MRSSRTMSMLISTALHATILSLFATWTYAIQQEDEPLLFESVFVEDEDRLVEEFQQVEETIEVAETLNLVSGSVSSVAGQNMSARQPVIQPDVTRAIEAPAVRMDAAAVAAPALDTLADDLGEADIKGEIGAVVEGYGPALDRLTKELLRLLRSHELTVVWLFDESGSMKDDQQQLKQRLDRVYRELSLRNEDPKWKDEVRRSGRRSSNDADVLQTLITSFGGSFHVHTPKATSDLATLMEAIDRIPVDDSGAENMCQALLAAMDQYKGVRRAGRRLVFVVVSDESGDDGHLVEEVRQEALRLKAPMYFLGREAVFGSLYAHVRWRQPETGRLFYLPIRRGPETPFSEQLQFDGLRRRRDSQMSGFGPYEQVRLARDTGGIFFQMPNEESNINDFQAYALAATEMRSYAPNLESRVEYEAERRSSDFRQAIWSVIAMLNPYDPGNRQLELPDAEYFPIDPAQSTPRVARRIQQIVGVLGVLTSAQAQLEAVKRYRSREPSLRWRANYDLLVAQLYAYRVRLFEYAIALEQFGRTMPERIKQKRSNRWSIRIGTHELIMPDEAQSRQLKVTADDLQSAHQTAQELLQKVIADHPNTPWSQRAEWEERRGYGATFGEHYFAPPRPLPPGTPPPPPPTAPPKL